VFTISTPDGHLIFRTNEYLRALMTAHRHVKERDVRVVIQSREPGNCWELVLSPG
jgi:hypothetical protein